MSEHINKETVLNEATKHVEVVRDETTKEIRSVGEVIERYRTSKGDDEIVRGRLLAHFSDRLDQLHHLFPSPYFIRCDVRNKDGQIQPIYFSKFSFVEQGIFSWMTPAARLRFADVGETSYPLADGSTWSGSLIRKDQFMIVGGRIVFMASEAENYGRTLIHQEQLSQRKAGFLLPEIVEKMERAQDDVIRAPARGSFLIAGPAGSGKTTLAFHRIAYLLQSPDTASQFDARNVIVFVQDEGTRLYFSRLLPDLGIHNVRVTTFGEWALSRLGLKDFTFIRRANGVDSDIDHYEYHKCLAMREQVVSESKQKNPASKLTGVYDSVFSLEEKKRFKAQLENKQLDRFDLTILLKSTLTKGPLTETRDYFEQKKNYEVIRKQHTVPLQYSLIVVDEAQNYLPEQVEVLRSCVADTTRAMLYVGDLEQQVLFGTLRDWSLAGEQFAGGQRVQLEKVYRNTRSILEYLKSLAFNVTVPEELREGEAVVDTSCSIEEEFGRVTALVESKDAGTQVGILSPSEAYLSSYRTAFSGKSNVHVLTMHEAQGVEFECVCIVGVPEKFFKETEQCLPEAFHEERLRIKKDLIYVALTRAMDELHIFGRTRLVDLFLEV